MSEHRVVFEVEIEQRQDSTLTQAEIISTFEAYLDRRRTVVLLKLITRCGDQNHYVMHDFNEGNHQDINMVIISLPSLADKKKLFQADLQELNRLLENCIFHFFVFKLNPETCYQGDIEADNDTPYFTITTLPSQSLHGMWESIIIDSSIKQNLINFVKVSLLFSDHRVNSNLVSCNKILLLHGPPGTGKTSLCKGFAHKISIKMQKRFSYFQLIEINSHSLFSKWFSESGKMVLKLFNQIRDYLDNPNCMLFLLIDEIESLAYSRETARGSDPSDAIRVVNAILTQIDSLKNSSNVMVLATSNITCAIDDAFLDRADFRQYIPKPKFLNIYEIYRSCFNELIRTGLLYDKKPLEPVGGKTFNEEYSENSQSLIELAKKSLSMSGRTLRKLPLLAFAHFPETKIPVSVKDFLPYFDKAIEKHFNELKELD